MTANNTGATEALLRAILADENADPDLKARAQRLLELNENRTQSKKGKVL